MRAYRCLAALTGNHTKRTIHAVHGGWLCHCGGFICSRVENKIQHGLNAKANILLAAGVFWSRLNNQPDFLLFFTKSISYRGREYCSTVFDCKSRSVKSCEISEISDSIPDRKYLGGFPRSKMGHYRQRTALRSPFLLLGGFGRFLIGKTAPLTNKTLTGNLQPEGTKKD